MDSAQLYPLLAKLDSVEEMQRLDAVYKLGWAGDKRALPHLMGVLRNEAESPTATGKARLGFSAACPGLGIAGNEDYDTLANGGNLEMQQAHIACCSSGRVDIGGPGG